VAAVAVIKDYYYKGSHIVIHDDYFVSKEEFNKILEKIGIDASRAFMAAAIKASKLNDKTA
jgi:hypothetical protein